MKSFFPYTNWKNLVVAASCIGWISCITDDSKHNTKIPLDPNQAVQTVTDPNLLTTIQWLDTIINKGSVLEGTDVDVVFRFKNSGDKPLVIESAQPSCGCTVAEKPDQPIMPGQEGRIKAVFNSRGRTGHNHKSLTVRANTKPSAVHVVEFNVEVVGKGEGPKAATAGETKQF